ncbi:MAG: aldose 1-epimerase [Acidimicrobiia bacterium]|nr:aldose 1-epimerase [Acidimicrobiia bacterium]
MSPTDRHLTEPPHGSVRAHVVAGEAALTLAVGDATCTVLPELAMVGVGLGLGEVVVVSPHRAISDLERGAHTLGIPLLYPWANRLGGDTVDLGGTTVDLTQSPMVSRDPAGLPMHGTMLGRRPFDVRSVETAPGSVLVRSGIDMTAHPALWSTFPYEHDLEVTHELSLVDELRAVALVVSVTVHATGDRPVPVSFGWHPYFHLPSERSAWRLQLPERQALVLDDRMLPTGDTEDLPAEDVTLGDRTYDDAYRLVGTAAELRTFTLTDDGTSVRVVPGEGYAFTQLYVPEAPDVVAIEPMVAAADALVSGAHPTVAPGERYRATFVVEVEDHR